MQQLAPRTAENDIYRKNNFVKLTRKDQNTTVQRAEIGICYKKTRVFLPFCFFCAPTREILPGLQHMILTFYMFL